MFNQGGFNQLGFNQQASSDVLVSVRLSGRAGIKTAASIDISASAHISGRASVVADFIREIAQTVHVSGQASLSATLMRERNVSAHLSGNARLTANAAKYHVDSIEYTGDFEPGEKIVINAKDLTFSKDGQNAINEMIGDFFDLNPGVNELQYTDPETGRTLLVRITHRDRYLY
jgi:hypothetical protein